MKIKITDDRKEMAAIGRNLAKLSRADINSTKYKDYLQELDIFYPKFGGGSQRMKHFTHGFMIFGYMV